MQSEGGFLFTPGLDPLFENNRTGSIVNMASNNLGAGRNFLGQDHEFSTLCLLSPSRCDVYYKRKADAFALIAVPPAADRQPAGALIYLQISQEHYAFISAAPRACRNKSH